jgi:hypothetical protein
MLDTLTRTVAPVKPAAYHVSSQHIRFDFNPDFTNKYNGGRFDLFQAGFIPHYGRAADMLNVISEGYAVTPTLTNGRTKAHFTEAWHMMIDFDTDDERSALSTVANDPIVKMFGAFCYTTPSHTPDKPRCRAVFILDAPIKNYKGLELAYRSLLRLFPHADQACKNAARLYYGSQNADYVELWNNLPLDILRPIAAEFQAKEAKEKAKAEQQHKEVLASAGQNADRYHTAALSALLERIRSAPAGEKYNTRTKTAYAIGGKVGLGLLDRTSALAGVISAARTNSTTPDKAEQQAFKAFEAGVSSPG